MQRRLWQGRKSRQGGLSKIDEWFVEGPLGLPDQVHGWNRRLKWQVGRTYAVCPGRGKPAIGRIRLLEIHKEKLQDISDADCAAELGCLLEWPGPGSEPYKRNLRWAYADLWDSINPRGKRWADNPDVWALTFEVVR